MIIETNKDALTLLHLLTYDTVGGFDFNPILHKEGDVKYMPFNIERRKYQRCDCIICKALMSVDEKHWKNSELMDISAGGLSFVSNHEFEENSKVFFNLYVYNMLSEFNIKLEGRIIRIGSNQGDKLYSIKFENINKYQQVQLDELIKSRITLCEKKNEPVYEEEYSILLLTRFRPRTHRVNLNSYR